MKFIAFAVLCFLLRSTGTRAQSCVTQSFVGFDDSGNLLTLFNVSSAKVCCGSCATFEECIGFVWTNQFNGTKLNTTLCTLYNSNSKKVLYTNSGSIGGSYETSYKRNTACSSSSDTFYTGPVLKTVQVTPTSDCCSMCSEFAGCNYWVFNGTTCFFLTGQGQTMDVTGITSGTVIPNSVMRTPLRQPTKRGLGIFGTNSCSDLRLLSTNISWVHNFDTQPGLLEACMAQLGLEYIPTISKFYANVSQFEQYVNSTYTKSKYLMTFTNPNFAASLVTPAQAAAAWPIIQQFADKYNMSIGLPSATPGGGSSQTLWISQFMRACVGCRVDFVVANYFTCDTAQLTRILGVYMTIANQYNIPSLWLPSVTCLNQSSSSVLNFMDDMLPLLDSYTNLDRYAWYGTRQGVNAYNLFNSTTCDLTDVGLLYTGTTRNNHTNINTVSAISSTVGRGGTTYFRPRSSAATRNSLAGAQLFLFCVLIANLMM